MRKEVYEHVRDRLLQLYVSGEGDYGVFGVDEDVPEGWDRAVKHIDLWNHNVEFIEQESGWDRPAVFVEFGDIMWKPMSGRGEYTSRSRLTLHVVTDWAVESGSGLDVFNLVNAIHGAIQDMRGSCFWGMDLVESRTNHNHEELLESLEVYEYRGSKWISV